jgi:hypothetical protein
VLTEKEQDSLVVQLWHKCNQLLWNSESEQVESTKPFDLVLIYLKNLPNQLILKVADVVTGRLLSVPNAVPFLGVLGFDPNWKKSFEELIPYDKGSIPFMPRQSFQSIDTLILDRHW